MYRKSLFLGLTAMLIAALAWLIVQSRKKEAQHTSRPIAIVKESKPTLTRVLRPTDLEILESKLLLSRSDNSSRKGAKPAVSASHSFVIRNNGRVTYRNVMVEFYYQGRSGKTLETRTWLITEPILPGKTLSIEKLLMEAAPSEATTCTVKIFYSDLEAPTTEGRPSPR